MKIYFTFFAALLIFLVVVHCADTDSEVKKGSENGLGNTKPSISNQKDSSKEKTKGLDSDVGSKKGDPLKEGKEQVVDSKPGVQNTNLDNKDPSKQSGHKEAEVVQEKENDKQPIKVGDSKENADKGSGSKDASKDSVLSSTNKDNVRGEECDSSNKCTANANSLVACLRVPGNESPELSLLIQNMGKNSLNVKITAPDFVHLEKTTIQLQEKEGAEVKVTIQDGKSDKLIVLNAGDGDCSLDFRDLISHNPVKKSDPTSKFTYTNLFKRTPFLGFIFLFLAALLVIASILIYISFQRKRFQTNATNIKYQKLDMELPVLGPTVMTGTEIKEDESGWDDSWSDNWDDVEAPKTPSVPVTPSLSSTTSFTSRRVTKDGWKD